MTSSDQLHHSQKEDSPKRGSHDQEAELEKMRQLLHQEGQRREEERLRRQQQQQQLEQQLQQQQQQLLMRQDAINHQALLKLQVLYYLACQTLKKESGQMASITWCCIVCSASHQHLPSTVSALQITNNCEPTKIITQRK